MTRTRVLLTGANSFTGSHILSQLLSLDTVSVRAVVDSAEAAHALQRQYHHSSSSSLDLLTVCERDLLVPGVFDDALHDPSDPFNAVVHTLNSNHSDEADCLARFIKLQTDTVISFLKSIQDLSPAITRVVIVTSLIPFARWLGDPHMDRISGRAGDGCFRTSVVDTEYVLATSQASNNIVNDAVLAWTKQARPRFDIAVITAPSVYGPAVHPLENSSDLIETNRRIWNICSNEPLDQRATPPFGISHFSDVRDVADATVRALFVERASNTRLVVSSGIMPPEFEIAQFLIARFPELRGRIRMDDSRPQQSQREDPPLDFLDTYLITTILGITQLRSSEVTLTDTVRQMLDLQHRKAWKSVTQS